MQGRECGWRLNDIRTNKQCVFRALKLATFVGLERAGFHVLFKRRIFDDTVFVEFVIGTTLNQLVYDDIFGFSGDSKDLFSSMNGSLTSVLQLANRRGKRQ
jgi:hypothetical protein